MDRNRLLELAIEEIARQKAAVEAEIGTIRAELGGFAVSRRTMSAGFTTGKRRSRTPAERKTQSLRMKKYWAAKRGRAAKKRAAAPKPKARAAINKAISDAMRVYWAKRKAKASGKAAKTKPVAQEGSRKSSTPSADVQKA